MRAALKWFLDAQSKTRALTGGPIAWGGQRGARGKH